MNLLKVLTLSIAVLMAAPVHAQVAPNANMEILRQKIKADKKVVVAANMNLTDAEAKGFWPVYDVYQGELEQINKRLSAVIRAYADAYGKGPVPDELAKKLVGDTLAIEESEIKLKRAYMSKLEKVVPAAKAARYIQIENKIRAIIRFDLADGIPLIP